MAKLPEKPKQEHLSQRVLCVMAGAVWGLVLAPGVALTVAEFLGGLNWPLIAGTRDWPQWADWIIVASAVISGLSTFFVALIIGRNIGDRLEYSHDFKLRSGVALPWAVIVVGVAVGGINAVTLPERQRAVVGFVVEQKEAQDRLLEFARNTQRFRSARVDWPGAGAEGRILLIFRGKHQGNYQLIWEIWDASGAKEPVMEGNIGAILTAGDKHTDLPLSPLALASAWLQRQGSKGLNARVSENFTLKTRLIPELTRDEWKQLPQHEPDNLADGKSILIDEATATFPVDFEIRGGQIIWQGS